MIKVLWIRNFRVSIECFKNIENVNYSLDIASRGGRVRGNKKWKARKIEISREIIMHEIWIVEGVKSN